MSWKKVAIGIDLGTTKCSVGIVRDGKVEILENERSSKTTPSYVAFTDTERLIGEDAKDQATLNPTNTVFGVKRLLGRQFDDPAVQEQVPRRLPFVVDKNERRKPCIGVTYKKEPRTLFPEQVTAMLLTKMRKIAQTQLNCPVNDKMKELAQDRLGCSIEDAVISVPASFSNAQRQATEDAATIAGLKVLALINEPTAAAIAYQANRKAEDEETIAVVDFGGGKFEVSIVLVNKSAVEVKAVFGCPDFGGSDIDNLIIELLIRKFRERTGIDLSIIIKARERLRGSCESLKHTLSLLPEARVQLDCLSADTDFNETITRKEFEETVGPKTRKSLDQVHHEMSFYVKEHGLVLRKVLLVGGSTRIPLVQRWLEERFGSTKLDKTVNPDEAVAQGAAVWAAMLGGDNTVTDLRVGDVLGRAIVMEQEGKQHVLYDQFAPVPAKTKLSIRSWHGNTDLKLFETKSITADEPLQTLAIFQCEWRLASLKFEFFVNPSGICSVSEMSNGEERELNTLIFETLRLFQKSDMANMIEVEELFERDTMNEQMRIAALSELESYCFKQKNRLESLLRCKNISKSTFSDFSQRVEDMIAWIDCFPSESESLYNLKQLELKAQCDENLPKDEIASLRRPSSKRSSSANVSAQTESYDISRDRKVVPTDRKSRRDQTNGDDSESRQRRFVSHSAQRSGRKRGESPARVEKSIGTSDGESRQGKNGEQDNLPNKPPFRDEKDKRTRSLPRRDGSEGLRANPASREQTAAASHKANEVSVRNHSSDRKLREEALTGPKDRNQLVEYEEQRHDGVQRNDVGPPKIKPPLLPSVRHTTTYTNRSPPDQPGEDHGTHVISSHGNGITQSSDRTEVTSDLVSLKTEEDSVITRNRIQSSSNEFTARSSSRLDHGKPSSHSREKAASGVRSTPVIKEEVIISSSPQAEDSESKQSASAKTSYSTERASCDDNADICYGYSFERPKCETRSIGVQMAGKKSETGDICGKCHVQKSCGCTIAASLASSNKIRSTPHFSINEVGTSNSRYDPTKYATPLTTVAVRDSLQNIPSSSTRGVQYSNGTYTAALTSPVSRSVAPLAIAQDDSRCRVTSTISSLAAFSSVVNPPYTLNLIKANENGDLRGLTESVGEIRVGAGHDYKVKSAKLIRADTGLESDSTIGSRPDPRMRADRPRTTSSSIQTRSKSRAEGLVAEAYSLNIDPDCVCGSGKVHCSDCRSARHMRKDTIGIASSVPSSSILVREAMTATSSGSNLDSNYVRKYSNDTLHDELRNHKCQCGSGKSTCVNCYTKYLQERTATSSGGANTRHLNPPGHSLSVPYSDDSSSMRSHGSSKRTHAVYIPRESSAQANISFRCICYKNRTKGCVDCYLKRSMQL